MNFFTIALVVLMSLAFSEMAHCQDDHRVCVHMASFVAAKAREQDPEVGKHWLISCKRETENTYKLRIGYRVKSLMEDPTRRECTVRVVQVAPLPSTRPFEILEDLGCDSTM